MATDRSLVSLLAWPLRGSAPEQLGLPCYPAHPLEEMCRAQAERNRFARCFLFVVCFLNFGSFNLSKQKSRTATALIGFVLYQACFAFKLAAIPLGFPFSRLTAEMTRVSRRTAADRRIKHERVRIFYVKQL